MCAGEPCDWEMRERSGARLVIKFLIQRLYAAHAEPGNGVVAMGDGWLQPAADD